MIITRAAEGDTIEMTETRDVKVGVVGCGTIAQVGHLPWLHQNPHAEIAAVADPWEKNRKRVVKKYHVPREYASGEALLDESKIDAVVICTPNWLHEEQARAAAARGIHVLCEKPVCTTVRGGREMMAEVQKAGVVFQTATQKRFQWGFQRIKEALEAGRLGEVFQATTYWYHAIPDLEHPVTRRILGFFKKLGLDLPRKLGAWRLTDPRAGGGDFMDHGPHYVDLWRYWFGELRHVSAEFTRVIESRAHEDHGVATFRVKDANVICTIERSECVKGRPHGEERGHVHGRRGSFYFEVGHEYRLEPVELYRYTTRNYIRNKASRIKVPQALDQTSYKRQCDAFIAQVRDDDREFERLEFPRAWVPTVEDGVKAVEAVFAAYHAAATHEVVQFPFTPGPEEPEYPWADSHAREAK